MKEANYEARTVRRHYVTHERAVEVQTGVDDFDIRTSRVVKSFAHMDDAAMWVARQEMMTRVLAEYGPKTDAQWHNAWASEFPPDPKCGCCNGDDEYFMFVESERADGLYYFCRKARRSCLFNRQKELMDGWKEQ